MSDMMGGVGGPPKDVNLGAVEGIQTPAQAPAAGPVGPSDSIAKSEGVAAGGVSANPGVPSLPAANDMRQTVSNFLYQMLNQLGEIGQRDKGQKSSTQEMLDALAKDLEERNDKRELNIQFEITHIALNPNQALSGSEGTIKGQVASQFVNDPALSPGVAKVLQEALNFVITQGLVDQHTNHQATAAQAA